MLLSYGLSFFIRRTFIEEFKKNVKKPMEMGYSIGAPIG
jgi:hypothetical protein